MHEINANLSDIMGRQSVTLELSRKALVVSNANSRLTMEIVLVENRELVGKLLAVRSENSKEISGILEEIEGQCKSEKEKQLLSAVKGTRKPYADSSLRAIHLLVDEGKHDESEAVMVNETLPALTKHHAAWDDFVEFQRGQVDAAVKQAQADYVRAHRFAAWLILLALGIALAVALFAIYVTAREIALRIDAEQAVSKLNESLEEKVTQRTSELSEASKDVKLRVAALEAAANAIVITDSDGTILWVNHAFTSMTGYGKEEVLGKNHSVLQSGVQPS